MVINADLHQAAISGQDDKTVKYVQSISSLCRVPVFQITAVLIGNAAETLTLFHDCEVAFVSTADVRGFEEPPKAPGPLTVGSASGCAGPRLPRSA